MYIDQNNCFDVSRPPRPLNYPPMTPENRAAQFAPFSALTGLDDALEDTSHALLFALSCMKNMWESGLMQISAA